MSQGTTVKPRRVAILGASPYEGKPSYQAVVRYVAAGWIVWPVRPDGAAVAHVPSVRRLSELPGPPDLICVYLNPHRTLGELDAIVATGCTILWLNPGADSNADGGASLVAAAASRGLRVIEACTLVVLSWGDPWQVANDPSKIATA